MCLHHCVIYSIFIVIIAEMFETLKILLSDPITGIILNSGNGITHIVYEGLLPKSVMVIYSTC